MTERTEFRLTVSCPDQMGIVARVARLIADAQGWITEAAQHTDTEARWFFMRWVFSLPQGGDADLAHRFEALAGELNMQWSLTRADARPRVVIMVSKEPHCLTDVLARWKSGELPMEIPAIVSNHRLLEEIAACYGIPFEHIPVTAETRDEAFLRLQQRLRALEAETVVLARYMQILPPTLCTEFEQRVINIHHSFLPSFVGARPYHQAFARGVKLIGATCHYVTEDLDAGPIIEQDVVRIRHDDQVADLVRKGRDVERWVLARGLRYHLEGRVLTHGNKTIVFD
ncbi:Formyltetrahydrofolate deformylase [Thioalkalivibrio nitratireducens DSM 14787]|uniref:Formyltetrahydrofolate deformylase n=1 Tax=Thioalkalivibrio nitratireducens (strain DSM 14787 / UNIQEM 213 / ALEN2) TaxID=1255043 RepID=L0DTK6_THIND|nr:formyltetrahydrofolate deformylase [Thioalkalivibrio nitratireducens]AGA32919.1 Formyltetrahydrofolate deformylase [Thioalkalivibrio nitratireducens DSM 14787]